MLLAKEIEPVGQVVIGEAVKLAPPSKGPQEYVVVCIDRSGSMGSPFESGRTRMEAVKQMFYAFRDCVESLDTPGGHQLGLVQYDQQVSVHGSTPRPHLSRSPIRSPLISGYQRVFLLLIHVRCIPKVDTLLGLTADLTAFENCVDDMKQRGATAIYAAIEKGAKMLRSVARVHSHADLRVLLLSDGQNNENMTTALDAFEAANSIGVVVDAILVGSSVDNDLRKATWHRHLFHPLLPGWLAWLNTLLTAATRAVVITILPPASQIVQATKGECYQIDDLESERL